MIGGTAMQHSSEVFFGSCSGTMIAPHIILTAGHCVLGFDQKRKIAPFYQINDELLVQSFDGPGINSKRSFIVHVSKSISHSSWEKALGSSSKSADQAADMENVYDVGILVLDRNLPITPSELPPLGIWDNIPKGTAGLLVFGAGCQERGYDNTSGTMKAALYTELQRYPSRIETKPNDVLTNAPAGPCKRDSGGGGFILHQNKPSENKLIFAAVASIMSGTSAQALAPAPTGMYLARIDKPEVLDWVATVLRQKAPTKVASNLEPSKTIPPRSDKCIARGRSANDSACYEFRTEEECKSGKNGTSCIWE
jgi:hypothetical protein